eukprot:scaffold223440_cov37-Tisochrysis_lutea.AAC.1
MVVPANRLLSCVVCSTLCSARALSSSAPTMARARIARASVASFGARTSQPFAVRAAWHGHGKTMDV